MSTPLEDSMLATSAEKYALLEKQIRFLFHTMGAIDAIGGSVHEYEVMDARRLGLERQINDLRIDYVKTTIRNRTDV